MKNKTIILIGAFILACVLGGFLAGWRIKSQQSRRELAERTYRLFEAQGFTSVADGGTSAIWREELADRLQRELARPWSPTGLDHTWGAAYATVRDQGDKSWRYVQGTSPCQQDEMIRYLCFRIERASGDRNFSSCYTEFQSLVGYPEEAINRNREKIARAVQTATSSSLHQVKSIALVYAVYLAQLDWGWDLCWECLDRAANPTQGDCLTWMLSCLDGQAKGSPGLVNSVLKVGKPSAEAQAGAAGILARFLQTEPRGVGTGNRAIIREWKDKLKETTSCPATQRAQ